MKKLGRIHGIIPMQVENCIGLASLMPKIHRFERGSSTQAMLLSEEIEE
jgi:hypothetical protein